MIEILSWISTLFFFIGAYIYSGKKQKYPRTRMTGFIIYCVGGTIYIYINLFMQFNLAFASCQVVFNILDIRAIYHCWKEIKEQKQ